MDCLQNQLKRFLPVLGSVLFVLCASNAFAQCSGQCVQKQDASTPSGSTTTGDVFGSTDTLGNYILASVGWCFDAGCGDDITQAVTGITDPQSNTYVFCGKMTGVVGWHAELWVAKITTAGTAGPTATISGTPFYQGVVAREISGLSSSAPCEGFQDATGIGTSVAVTMSGAPTASGEFTYAYGVCFGTTLAVDGSYTLITQISGNGLDSFKTGSGSAATSTMTCSPSAAYYTFIAAFKSAPAGTSVPSMTLIGVGR